MSLTLEKGTKSYPPTNIQVLLCNDNHVVGELNGYSVDVSLTGGVDGSECYEEIYELMERYPELIDEDGFPRIAELYQSDIVKDYRGQGFGTQMYIEFMRRFWIEETKGKPFILIPNGCNLDMEGNNTIDSIRVWNSLSRKFPSSGSDWTTCIAVLRKPPSMSQRVARTSPKYNITFETFWDSDDNLFTVATNGSTGIGNVETDIYEITVDDVEDFECSDDIENLIHKVPKTLSRSDEIFIVEVTSSWLMKEYRGKGLGYEMYLNLIQYFYKDIRRPFLFIPNYCNQSETSVSARRVWKSLSRKYQSSGDVILIDKYPTK